MATHSGTLAWKIPWTGEPGGLQSMGSQSRTRLKRLSSSSSSSSSWIRGLDRIVTNKKLARTHRCKEIKGHSLS